MALASSAAKSGMLPINSSQIPRAGLPRNRTRTRPAWRFARQRGATMPSIAPQPNASERPDKKTISRPLARRKIVT